MNEEDALKFLRKYQPMPDDTELSQVLIEEYDLVRRYFKEHPCQECIGLFLGSFGKGDGLGVYPLVEDTLLVHDNDEVVHALAAALENGDADSKYWSAQFAANFPDKRLIDGLYVALHDGREDTREAAVTALEVVGTAKAKDVLVDRLTVETDDAVKDLIADAVDKWEE